jgi:hypothetical protein
MDPWHSSDTDIFTEGCIGNEETVLSESKGIDRYLDISTSEVCREFTREQSRVRSGDNDIVFLSFAKQRTYTLFPFFYILNFINTYIFLFSFSEKKVSDVLMKITIRPYVIRGNIFFIQEIYIFPLHSSFFEMSHKALKNHAFPDSPHSSHDLNDWRIDVLQDRINVLFPFYNLHRGRILNI